MGVDIDDAGHDDPAGKAALDGALRNLRRGASADADDPVVLQQDPAFLVDLILFVLRMICAPYSSVCMVDSSFTLEI